MFKSFIESVLVYVICDVVSHGFDFIAAAPHSYADCAAFEHRNVDLRVAESYCVGDVCPEIGQEFMDSMGFGDVLNTEVTEESRLAGTAPRVVLEVGELDLRVKEILIAAKDIV